MRTCLCNLSVVLNSKILSSFAVAARKFERGVFLWPAGFRRSPTGEFRSGRISKAGNFRTGPRLLQEYHCRRPQTIVQSGRGGRRLGHRYQVLIKISVRAGLARAIVLPQLKCTVVT